MITKPPFPPGYYLCKMIDQGALDPNQLRTSLSLTPAKLILFLNGQFPVNPVMAIQLAHLIGTSPDVWLNLDKQYQTRTNHQLWKDV